jgi:hypothetical protein
MLIVCSCWLLLADWIVADMLAMRQGSIGHLRYILKDSLKYLPFFGPYFPQVFVFFSYFSLLSLDILAFLIFKLFYGFCYACTMIRKCV